MPNVMSISSRVSEADLWQQRIDLAAAFRLAARNEWHEAAANHFSLATSADGKTFLMNPRWRHFGNIRASELLLLDVDDKEAMKRPNAPDLTAWHLHGRLHASLPHARCIMHLHPTYATALASLAKPDLLPIDQNTARFYNRIAFDLSYGGMANSDEEGLRLARLLGNKSVMIMGNHGILVCATTVAEAYDVTYYLERACRNLLLAYQSGQPLAIMSHDVAEKTAREWEDYGEHYVAHFNEMKLILNREDASYAT